MNTEVNAVRLRVALLEEGARELVPERATPQAAGLDLKSSVDLVLERGKRALVPTGIRIALPDGYEGQVRPRSGLALKHGITCLNSPGTIDADYRGELKVILINHGEEPFAITRGMRIAQLVVAAVAPVAIEVVATLDETERGTGGFGSTGR